MGSEYCNPSKPHYDISMSKRTRKPLMNLEEEEEVDQSPPERESLAKEVYKEEDKSINNGGEDMNDHKSLKQLIKGRSSLGQHFTEEKQQQQLQVVVKQHEEGLDGVKFKTLVSHYARVLSRLIKIQRDPRVGSRNKPVLRLTM